MTTVRYAFTTALARQQDNFCRFSLYQRMCAIDMFTTGVSLELNFKAFIFEDPVMVATSEPASVLHYMLCVAVGTQSTSDIIRK